MPIIIAALVAIVVVDSGRARRLAGRFQLVITSRATAAQFETRASADYTSSNVSTDCTIVQSTILFQSHLGMRQMRRYFRSFILSIVFTIASASTAMAGPVAVTREDRTLLAVFFPFLILENAARPRVNSEFVCNMIMYYVLNVTDTCGLDSLAKSDGYKVVVTRDQGKPLIFSADVISHSSNLTGLFQDGYEKHRLTIEIAAINTVSPTVSVTVADSLYNRINMKGLLTRNANNKPIDDSDSIDELGNRISSRFAEVFNEVMLECQSALGPQGTSLEFQSCLRTSRL